MQNTPGCCPGGISSQTRRRRLSVFRCLAVHINYGGDFAQGDCTDNGDYRLNEHI